MNIEQYTKEIIDKELEKYDVEVENFYTEKV